MGRTPLRPRCRRAGAAVLVLLATLATLLSGCGLGSGESRAVAPAPRTTPGSSLYTQLAARMQQARTVRFVFSGTGGGQTFAGSGALTFADGSFAGNVALTLPESGRVTAILSPRASYLALPAAKGLSKRKPWVKVTDQAQTPVARELRPVVDQLRSSFDPEQSLGLLRAAHRVQELGPATVEGVPTTHYRADLDLRRARQVATGPTREQFQSMLEAGARTLAYDIWVDTRGLPRRYSARLPTTHGLFSVTGVYREWGSRIRIVTPGPKQVWDAAQLKG